MRLEQIPILIGAIVGLFGLGLLIDAWFPEGTGWRSADRRRRARAEPHRGGEALVGIGTLCMAAALIGRDTWAYGNVAVIAGSILILIGALLNHRFLREALLFRGPARRQPEREPRQPGDAEARQRDALDAPRPAAPMSEASAGDEEDRAPAADGRSDPDSRPPLRIR